MNHQRQLRSELHDFLHQGLMQLYMSYSSTIPKEKAIQLVLSELDSVRSYFEEHANLDKPITPEHLRDFWEKQLLELEDTQFAHQQIYAIDQYEEAILHMKDIQQQNNFQNGGNTF